MCREVPENMNKSSKSRRPKRSMSDAIYAVYVNISKAVFTSVYDIS